MFLQPPPLPIFPLRSRTQIVDVPNLAFILRCCLAVLVLLPALCGLLPAGAAGSPGPDVHSVQTGTGTAPVEPALQTSPTGSVPASSEEVESPNIVDLVHAEISHGIQGTATWMDSFFGDWRYARELNESYVRFGYNVVIEEGTPLYRKPDLQIRIVLPQLRKKTRLVFSGTPRENRDFSAVTLDAQREQPLNTEDTNVTAAVHQTFFESAKQNFIIRAGAKLHDLRPVLALGPRYRVLFPLEKWNLRFSEDMTWTSNKGWDSQTTIDLERPLPYQLFFRASNSWIRKEHTKGYLYAASFSVAQLLSRLRGIDYEWVNIFQTRPARIITTKEGTETVPTTLGYVLMEVDLRVRYRQRLWRDWFFFEIAPQCRFPRDRNFKATPGVLFRIDLIFGNYANFL